ncbi:DNA primase DnaG [Halocatena marina]|uniref:DNA primase DnaG n=1 Tax=Halocatena marina TaxID=2934937 RepID=UPI002010302E|nr:DNA primase DnaG [Halocatena marina]
MYDTAKYLIHANITAEGVVERSDVVGAIFGQTEGLLGDELDLRDLQDSSKVGRIDVDINSEHGQSFGTVTIASGLDQVETAILAASLETIERVGPCRSRVEIDRIEDVRAAKRRTIVDRAKTLLGEAFDGGILTSEELVEEVRRSIRVDDITEYQGLPAGPRVADSDAIIVVEGRADVLTLLQYGVKNAIGVEGTNIPEPIIELTDGRTVTAFFDGDRGGDLILKELAQVADVDYVAITPTDQNVEDLSRGGVMKALREKIPYELVAEANTPREAMAATDGSTRPAPPAAAPPQLDHESDETANTEPDEKRTETLGPEPDTDDEGTDEADTGLETSEITDTEIDRKTESNSDSNSSSTSASDTSPAVAPETLHGHVRQVIIDDTGAVRLLDEMFVTLDDAPAVEAFDRIKAIDTVPTSVVLDDELSQRVLDIAAQRGVDQIIAKSMGDFVKQPATVRIRTAEQLIPSEA